MGARLTADRGENGRSNGEKEILYSKDGIRTLVPMLYMNANCEGFLLGFFILMRYTVTVAWGSYKKIGQNFKSCS